MKTVSLSGSLRANVGKVDATAVRAKGHVPCVIYGAGEQIHFSTDIRNFKNIIFTPETSLVEIDVDGIVIFSKLTSGRMPNMHDITCGLASLGFKKLEG